LDQEKRAKWNVKDASDYSYLNKSGCIVIEGVDDAKDFEETKEGREGNVFFLKIER